MSANMLLRTILVVYFVKEILAKQRFEKQPAYTEVNPSQDAYIECKILNKKGTCSWQKDNKPIGMYTHKYDWAAPNQQNGDCSIWIRAAQIDFDDGFWECQVTASDFHTQDALTSQPVRLVVRVSPQRPRMEFEGNQVLPGHNLTATHGQVASIKCISHYGNPPALLKWFLDHQELTPARGQINTTEMDNSRTWMAVSVLELTISKEFDGRMLSCVALHESYSTKSVSVEVRLDVMFVPETRLVGMPSEDVEDLKDPIAIRCVVNANPKATVAWTKEGQTQAIATQELLQFSPATRQNSGLYVCAASNRAGESPPLKVHIDVKYRPKVISVGRERVKTATLHSPVSFECFGEGNPPPTYKWLQKRVPGASMIERGQDAKFYISNVSYDLQGEWRCQLTNFFKKKTHSVLSEPVILQVHGAPQVLKESSSSDVFVENGQNVDATVTICADPRPRTVAWEWGSLRLETGNEHGRYKVDELIQAEDEDCYLTTFHVKETTSTDSRSYYLIVENDKGRDSHSVQLYVNATMTDLLEPMQISTIVGVTLAVVVIGILLTCACIYSIRAEKCCFARKGDFNPASTQESPKSDMERQSPLSTQTHFPQLGPGGIPADAIYTAGIRGGHPDAMKNSTTHTYNGRTRFEERYHLPQKYSNMAAASSIDFDTLAVDREHHNRYHSFNHYEPNDNWSYATTRTMVGSYGSKYKKRSHEKVKARPKPLPPDNDKYYDFLFPKGYYGEDSSFMYGNRVREQTEL